MRLQPSAQRRHDEGLATPGDERKTKTTLKELPQAMAAFSVDEFVRTVSKACTLVRRLEQFHGIAIRVFQLNLSSARTGFHLVAKTNTRLF